MGLGLVVLAVALVMWLRPAGSDDDARAGVAPTATDSSEAPPSASSATPPATTSDEAFCDGFRRLAEVQGEFVATGDGGDPAPLRAAADDLVAAGVPQGMSLVARSGYDTLLGGVYDSIGLELDPAAIGAPAAPVTGGDAAFSAYLAQFCPA